MPRPTLPRLSALALALLGCAGPGPGPGTPDGPQWIWCGPEARDGERALFRRVFEAPAGTTGARLWIAADDRMEATLNGTLVAQSTSWSRPVEADVAAALVAGANELVVLVANGGGPAGLCVELELEGAEPRVVRSGADWQVLEPSGRSAVALGPLGSEPWTDLEDAAPPVFTSALDGAEVEAPPGHRVELLHSVRPVREGSWVSLAGDGRGRLWASDQERGLYCITPPPLGTTGPCRVERVPLELPGAQGLAWAFGALYAVVNQGGEPGSGLYRLRDTTGDGELDAVELLRALDGSGEHGPHAVVPDPDGDALYVVAGNHTELPELAASRVPRLWDEDRVLPTMPDPNGHANDRRAPGGWIARTDPEGREWELVAVGLRNAYDLAFDGAGELYTYDSDMEWDVGLPWYRPTRVLHVTSGAELGWRHGSGKWPAHAPDALPALADAGRGSPTGVLHGRETGLAPEWRAGLLLGDWSRGRILFASLAEGERGTVRPFVSGRPLPVTDLATLGDGALYFTTGGRGVQSGLYRVVREEPGGELAADPLPAEAPAVQARRRLEALHLSDDPAGLDVAWPRLDDGDASVRFAARTAVEHRPAAAWRDRAWEERRPRASLEALLALARADAELDVARLAERVLAELGAEPAELRRWLRVLEVALARHPGSGSPEVGSALLARWPTGDAPTDRELLRLAAHLGAPDLAARAAGELPEVADQERAIALANALAHWGGRWTDETWVPVAVWLDELLTAVTGGESARAYVEEILAAAYANAGASQPARAEPRVAAAPEEGGERAPARVGEPWTVAALVPALARLGAADRESGRTLFERATCHTCHRFEGSGGFRGPDLEGVGARLGPNDLLRAVVDPSADVPDAWRDVELWTGSEVVVGRLVQETQDAIVLHVGLHDRRVEVPREDVELRRPSPLSPMPNGLLDPLTEDEVLDLLAYLLLEE